MTDSSLPKVSIVIPCYEAHAFVVDAVGCALAQTYPNFEVIIAPDDGDNYTFLREIYPSPALKILSPHTTRQTGAGATRNRAIEAASGDYFATLDADDLIPVDYIDRLASVARIEGAAVAPTSYVRWGTQELVRSPAITGSRLDLRGLGKLLCSMLPMVHRSLEPGFTDGFAEDVLRAGLIIAKAGGITVVKETSYFARIRQGSACSPDDNSEHVIQLAYATRQEQILTRPSELGAHVLTRKSRIELAELFEFRAYASQKFSESGADCYNAWAAHQEQALWWAFMADRTFSNGKNSAA